MFDHDIRIIIEDLAGIEQALGIKDLLDLIVGDNLGISSMQQQNFKISYSNPVSENLSLTVQSDIPVNLSIRVLNIQGQPLLETEYTGIGSGRQNLNTQSLRKGIYFLVVTDQASGRYATRFIKL